MWVLLYVFVYVSVCIHGWPSIHMCVPLWNLVCIPQLFPALLLVAVQFTVFGVNRLYYTSGPALGIHPPLLCYCSIEARCHTDFLWCRCQGSELRDLCWYNTWLSDIPSLNYKVLKNKTQFWSRSHFKKI